MKILDEFKKFAMRGNVIDLAVGVIIGGAFGKITTSLVNDIIMPPVGLMLGGVNFTDLYWNISGGQHPSLEAAKAAGAVTINYGTFINTLINFIIIAFAVFLLVQGINSLHRKQEAAPAAPAAPPRQEVLLEEIRDLLRKK